MRLLICLYERYLAGLIGLNMKIWYVEGVTPATDAIKLDKSKSLENNSRDLSSKSLLKT